ncbi:PcfJ domain-containing protein [Bacillus cereus]|uniref:PcfJ domain-containing protein n=1 Tax=Bacillus cereus TaxID=1396 RepID=UPI00159BE4CD|nr:PcfJ domain-containing protein [Bacillus cereus]
MSILVESKYEHPVIKPFIESVNYGLYFLFCPNCSYQGVQVDEKIDRRRKYKCPHCMGKVKFNQEYTNSIYKHKILHSQIKMNENNITFFIRWFKYDISHQKLNGQLYPIYKNESISYNIQKRQLYYIEYTRTGKTKNIIPISLGKKESDSLFDRFLSTTCGCIQEAENNKEVPVHSKIFLDQIFNLLPKYADKNKLNLIDAILLLKYPFLLNFPKYQDIDFSYYVRVASRKTLSHLEKSKGMKELVEIISKYPPSKKEISKMLTLNSKLMVHYLNIRRYIPNVGHRTALLEKIKWISDNEHEREYHMAFEPSEYQINRDDFYLFNPIHRKSDYRKRLFNFYKKFNLEDCFYEQIYTRLIKTNDIEKAFYSLDHEHTIKDTWLLINRISNYQEFPEFKEPLLKILRGKKTIFKVHDDLIHLNLEIRKKYPHNYLEPIIYSNGTIDYFECEIENINFKLPRSDIELFMVSDKLKNCVDGYYSSIKSYNCVIVYCTDHTGEIVACLEFRSHYGSSTRLAQALGYDNELLDEKVQNIVRKYCKERDIEIDCKYHIPDVKDEDVSNKNSRIIETNEEVNLHEVC